MIQVGTFLMITIKIVKIYFEEIIFYLDKLFNSTIFGIFYRFRSKYN